MILHLESASAPLALWAEQDGSRLSQGDLIPALAPLFGGWIAPIHEGRGVLHVLQLALRGQSHPSLAYSSELQEAAAMLPAVARICAVGRVVPILDHHTAQWRATVVPNEFDTARFQQLIDQWMRCCASTTLSRALCAKGNFYTYHDAWLANLRAPIAPLRLRPECVNETAEQAFATDVEAWASPAFAGERSGFELHLTIDQAGGHLTFGNGTPEALVQLGQAISIAPMLASPQPWEALTVERFLRDAVPSLRAAGFTIHLPEGFEASVPQVLEVAEAMTAQGIVLRQTILFAGVEMSVAEAQAILDQGDALIYMNGQWRYVDLGALRLALQGIGPAIVNARHALPLLLAGAWRISPEAQDVQDFLRELTTPPDGGPLPLRETLRPYQAQGVCWMMQAAAHGLGVCLADDMGLGKTLQTIAFLMTRKRPALVVAPLTVLPVWEKELKTFAPNLRVYRHEGPLRLLSSHFLKAIEEADIVLTAYGYLWRDYATLRRVSWDTLVLDEAQQIKNPSTRQSQSARSLNARVRIALTGTPIENRLEDLWSILDFLNPDLFGTRRDFVERYNDPERLKRAVSHFLLRRLKSDPGILSELPPKIIQEHYAPLTPTQSAAYDMALAEYTQETRQNISGSAGRMLTLLTELKQICDSPELAPSTTWHPEHSGKILTLLPLIDQIRERGESILIFTQFARMGAKLQQLLQERLGQPIAYLHGALTPKKRKEQLALFSDTPGPSILILSLKTGAFGLTLTKANHVIHIDRWWNPAVEAQATDRAHRMGQQRTVVVHHIICRGTLEESIDRLLREKRDLAESIIAPTPASLLAKLPADTLVSLLKRQE